MGSNELLTVREFAQAAGVSRQRIYQLIDDDGELSSYVVDYHGRRMLKAEGLRLFGCMDIIVDDLTSDKDAQSGMNSDIDVSCQERLDTESSRTFDTVTSVLGDELEILKQELGMLQEQLKTKDEQLKAKDEQLKAKDEQIARQQEHIDKQFETIQALTIISQRQLIDKSGQGSEVMDAVEVSEVPEDPEGEGSKGSSSEESAAVPKRRGPLGMFADAVRSFRNKDKR